MHISKCFRWYRMMAAILLLVMLCTLIPLDSQATAAGYMTLEQAAAVIAQKAADRDKTPFSVSFTYDSAENLGTQEIIEILEKAALAHNGKGNQGDYLLLANCNIFMTDVQETFDGKTHYITVGRVQYDYATTDLAEEQLLEKKIQQVLASLQLSGKSDYDKIFAIYDYICQNVTYDTKTAEEYGIFPDLSIDRVRHAYTAYGAMINGSAVCHGYTMLLYRMLLDAGIDSRIVMGGIHSWNIVQLDGKYYYLDATWDEGLTDYLWFLRGSSFVGGDHRASIEYCKPEFTAKYPVPELDYGQAPAGPATGKGSFTDSITWELAEDGTLTIRGSGPLPNQNLYIGDSLRQHVRKVVIEHGITAIGDENFQWYFNVQQVQIPNTVESVGTGAFAACTKLQSVYLPDSVQWIGADCFNYCLELKTLRLSESLTEIPQFAFNYCLSLEGVQIPASVRKIGQSAFASAFSISGNASITIPETVTELGDWAFAWSFLGAVTVHTPQIPEYAFYWSPNLRKVTLGDAVTQIGEEAFAKCYQLGNVKLPKNLQKAGYRAFAECYGMTQVEIPNTLNTIAHSMYELCEHLSSVTIAEGVQSIEQNAFYGCLRLEHITIPASVRKMGAGVFFQTVANMQSITFLGDAPELAVVEGADSFLGFYGTVYYPQGNATWDPVKNDPGHSMITFSAMHSDGTAHTAGQQWHQKDGWHWKECTVCGEHMYEDRHKMVYACQQWCSVCGYVDAVYHDVVIFSDETHHWGDCQRPGCDYQEEREPHTGNATCTQSDICDHCNREYYGHDIDYSVTPAKCRLCGQTLGDSPVDPGPVEHTHEFKEMQGDEHSHWYCCIMEGCTARDGEVAHDYSQVPCGSVCLECGFDRNTHACEEWLCDDTVHVPMCSCGFVQVGAEEPHRWQEAESQEDGKVLYVCQDCQYALRLNPTEKPPEYVEPDHPGGTTPESSGPAGSAPADTVPGSPEDPDSKGKNGIGLVAAIGAAVLLLGGAGVVLLVKKRGKR